MDDNEICFLVWWHRMSVFYAGRSMGGPTGVSKANVTLVHRRAIWREISKFRLQPTNVAHMPNDLGLARSTRCQVDSQPCKTNVNLTSLFFLVPQRLASANVTKWLYQQNRSSWRLVFEGTGLRWWESRRASSGCNSSGRQRSHTSSWTFCLL